ncbi:TonB-dependent receptor [Geothrix sp. PMB-07]|uniref:TonB-dependent receptor n=1 Tax=Geothrix sp. PMB-07 TaxID=3068640 RepID=UPI002741E1DA|nr:TonB-dependent receptor [Geothrix sp. PMB-07]WLT31934.1 TonB-dependent receptor [Geothrix sp. PMB-07]
MHLLNHRLGRLTALLASGGLMLVAQGVQTGSVIGTVKDSATGKFIPGATIVLKTPQGDKQTVSDLNGSFRFQQLPPNDAKLVISAPNHVSASILLRINIDKAAAYDVVLKPIQETGATVVVTAATAVAEPGDTKTGQNFALESVNSLPINNREIRAIASLTPGVSSDSNGITIRGSQATQVQFLVDGADVMDPVTGGPSVRLNEEMLEEVQVVTGGASAEYGRFTGGVVNTTTKSGTNEFSGVFRWDITNPGKWNALAPLQKPLAGANSTVQQYVVSGPVLKDRIFFVVGYRTTSPMTSTPNATTGVDGAGDGINKSFFATRVEERKDIKLDWQISTDHKVFWQYNKTESKRKNVDYATTFAGGSSGTEVLSSQNDTFSYVTFGYLGQITPSLYLNARFNHKKESLGGPGSGGQGGKAIPWIDTQSGTMFDNGFFGSDSDSRPIRTANIDATYFLEAAGSHEIKVGAQLFESQHNAANSQSPTNTFIYFNGFVDPNNHSTAISNRALTPNDTTGGQTFLDVWVPVFGATTKNRIDGYFINDKWKVNKNWAFNLGLRLDTFKSQNDLGVNNFDFKDLSPRLSATYDIYGDNRWVVSYNYSVYVGQVVQGATDSSSVVGNPAEYKYAYLGGDPLLRASWSNTPFFASDPSLFRPYFKTDPNLKTPRMREHIASLRHDDLEGTVWSIAFSKRKWDRFVDDFYTAGDPVSGQATITNKNDPTLTRDYWSVETTYQRVLNSSFSYGFNLTFSSLKGNFEGGQAGASAQTNNYGPTNIPSERLNPYGVLAADQPIQFIGNMTYKTALGKGHFSLSALQFYTSGAPYSKTVTSPSLANPAGAPSYYSGTFTNYTDGRGTFHFPETYRTDVQISYDYPVYNKLSAFARLNITNFFNTQELLNWNTTGGTYTLTQATAANSSYATNYTLPFKAGSSSFGKATSSSNYIAARALNLAVGFRF